MKEISITVNGNVETLNERQVGEMLDALAFYGDPDSYSAIAFMGDSPCGDFIDDFSENHNNHFYDRAMPGKKARNLIQRLFIHPSIQWRTPKFEKTMKFGAGWMLEGLTQRRKREDPKEIIRFIVYYSNSENKIFVEDLETGLKEEAYAIAPAQRKASAILKKEFNKRFPIDSDNDGDEEQS